LALLPLGAQTIVTSAIFAADHHILALAKQNGSGWDTLALRVEQGGVVLEKPVLLYHGGGYDLGARLAARGNQVFATWVVHAEDQPDAVQTTYVSTLAANGAPMSTDTVTKAVGNGPVDLAAEPSRLDLLMWDPDQSNGTLLSNTNGAFAARATFGTALGSPRIATDRCGVVLVTQTGGFSPDNPIPTGLGIARVSGDTIGDATAVKTSVDDIEELELTSNGSGVLVAWLEGGQGRHDPSRVLRAAFVTP
jgi:hypothetical protein